MKTRLFKLPKQVTVQEFKKYFNRNYSYISHELSDKEIYEFIKPYNFQGMNIIKMADLFSDYLLSQGLCNVQE